jgi:hypothetical protein
MIQDASTSEVARLIELAEVTKAYAKFGGGRSRGLRLLPGAVVSLVAAAAMLVSPRWGYFAACLVPVALLVGPSLWKGPYQRFGRVEPFSYAKPPSPWPVWVLSGAFWLLAVVQLSFRRGELADMSRPAVLATAGMLAALAFLAPLVGRTAAPEDAYGAAFLAAYMPRGSNGWIALTIYLAAIGLLLAGFAVVEHRRFRALEARMARLREPS